MLILASGDKGKVSMVVMAADSAVKKGIHSGRIIKEAAAVAGGGGGGRPDMAQAGGKDTSKIDKALEIAVETAKKQLNKQ